MAGLPTTLLQTPVRTQQGEANMTMEQDRNQSKNMTFTLPKIEALPRNDLCVSTAGGHRPRPKVSKILNRVRVHGQRDRETSKYSADAQSVCSSSMIKIMTRTPGRQQKWANLGTQMCLLLRKPLGFEIPTSSAVLLTLSNYVRYQNTRAGRIACTYMKDETGQRLALYWMSLTRPPQHRLQWPFSLPSFSLSLSRMLWPSFPCCVGLGIHS